MEKSTTHKKQISYCNGWFRAQKRYTELWDEKKARKAHEKGQLYTVLIGDPEKPDCFLEVHLKLEFIGVFFLDEYLRDYIEYIFSEVQTGQLFLEEILYREYERDTDKIIKANTISSKPDGMTQFREADLVTNEAIIRKGAIDVSENWEPVPEFGHYESISRMGRAKQETLQATVQ